MHKKFIVLIIIFFCFNITYTQNNYLLKVIDKSNISIITATIYINDTIVGITNNDGLYLMNTKEQNFKLEVSCIGFQHYTIKINNPKDTIIIKLQNKIFTNDIAIVNANRKLYTTKTVGYKWSPINGIMHLQPDMFIVNKINLIGLKNVHIKSINYYLREGKNEDASAQFKMLLLKHDTACNCPGEPLLDNYIASGGKNKKWFKVDISKEYIIVSNEIIYIGLKVMPKEYYEKPITTKYYKNYYVEEYKMPSIGFIPKQTNNTFMGYQINDVIKWSPNHFKFLCTTTIAY